MAHELDSTSITEAGEYSKNLLNRREYVKAIAVVAAIITGSGAGVTDSASADGTANTFSTGFGEYAK